MCSEISARTTTNTQLLYRCNSYSYELCTHVESALTYTHNTHKEDVGERAREKNATHIFKCHTCDCIKNKFVHSHTEPVWSHTIARNGSC